jgi:predicted MFS family arabinose efflux permease
MLLLARACMGISEGAFCPTSFATTAEASNPSRRGFNQGLQQSAFPLFGLGLGPILATQLLQFMSWRYVFALVAVPGLILAVLLAVVIREPVTVRKVETAQVNRAPFSEIFSHRNVSLGMIGLLCAMCGIFVLSANTPIYLTQYLGLSLTQMGFVTSAIGLGGFIGQWALPGLSDLVGRKAVAIASFALGAVFLWLFIRTGAGDLTLLFLLLLPAAGFSFGLLALITGPIATEAAPIGLISTVAGIIIGAGEIFGGGVAPFIAGGIAGRFGIQYTLYMALGGLLLGALVSLFYQETAPRKAKAVSQLDKLEKELGGSVAG